MSGLIPCHACGRPVAVGARCPHCGSGGSFAFTGTPDTPAAKGTRIMWALLAVAVTVLLLASAALR